LVTRFQGIAASVEQQRDRVVEVAQALNLTSVTLATDAATDFWQSLQTGITEADRATAIGCKIGVRPSEIVPVLQQIDAIALPGWQAQIHAASGLGKLTLPTATVETCSQIRALLQANGGFLTVLQAPIPFKQAINVWGYPGNALDLMQKLKRQFDPAALLSPDRYLSSI
jgi:glycolate oxidase FAD binding subunit